MSTRRLHIDLPLDQERAPAAGDVLVSTRAIYRIVDARPVESRVWPNRWHFEVHRIGTRPQHPIPPDGYRWRSKPYRRGETPTDHFGPIPDEETP